MVAITHMSNMLGTLVPVKEVVRLSHARGIPVLVDGAQASVHLDVDVQDIGCDFYAVTGHKLYGPTGIGALYGKYEHLAAMRPFNGGGEMIREVHQDNVTYGEPPHRFEAGTPPIVQASGFGAAIDYIESVGKPRIRAHETGLMHYAHERLREINSLRIIGTTKDKGPIISFELKGAHPHDVAHHRRPFGRGGACRHALRDAAARPFRGCGHLPRVVRALQHPRGDRRSRPVAGQGAGVLHMIDESGKPPVTAPERAADAPLAPASAEASALPETELARLTDEIIGALKTVYDPEFPSDIYELGLIYGSISPTIAASPST